MDLRHASKLFSRVAGEVVKYLKSEYDRSELNEGLDTLFTYFDKIDVSETTDALRAEAFLYMDEPRQERVDVFVVLQQEERGFLAEGSVEHNEKVYIMYPRLYD